MAPAATAIASPTASSSVAHSFCSSCPALDPSLHRCHRCAPPLCLIMIEFDLQPTVPSRANSALLLLSQPLLAGCLTAAPSSSPAAAPLVISTAIINRPLTLLLLPPSPIAVLAFITISPGEILLSAARQHRRLLPRQSTPTLSVLHSTVQRQLMLHPFCCACPMPDLLSAMLAPSFSARLTWLPKSTVVRPSPQLTT
ncbi:hypothetical protein B296_00011728 [Ensete ventricosum]|uniref:Uncharacterized protein n=1 Tax=Ensete ventricosum TaxID=4639 RepID=A0A426ZVQ2_ENSVE|nr:hypothetical protein B296_00011728 [Ensete ventricosum]